ncbi:hypothetical protein [Myxosarcina sp. GI1(2024)]
MDKLRFYYFLFSESDRRGIADGADWIWQHIPPLLNRLGCGDKTSYLVDFYHATEYLQVFADAAFSKEKERLTWFISARFSILPTLFNTKIS